MTDSIPLKQLKKLAKARGDAAAHRLGQLIEQRAVALRQLQTLLDYRRDYEARLESAARTGIQGEGLRNYRVFLANLERAIEQQTDVTIEMERRFDELQAEWTGAKRKVESYRVLGDREARTVAGKERRRQQALQDEMATRTFLKLVIDND
jgi:flagellar FliJ protein